MTEPQPKARDQRPKISQITAVYTTKCRRCLGPIREGEAIHIIEGHRGGMCQLCAGAL